MVRLGWIYAAALVLVLCIAAVASAASLRVVITEPSMTALGQPLADLKECKVFIRKDTAVLASMTVAASTAAGGVSRNVDFADLNAVETMTGVLARCEDTKGNVSLESAVFSFTFSDAPRPGTVTGVSIQP